MQHGLWLCTWELWVLCSFLWRFSRDSLEKDHHQTLITLEKSPSVCSASVCVYYWFLTEFFWWEWRDLIWLWLNLPFSVCLCLHLFVGMYNVACVQWMCLCTVCSVDNKQSAFMWVLCTIIFLVSVLLLSNYYYYYYYYFLHLKGEYCNLTVLHC